MTSGFVRKPRRWCPFLAPKPNHKPDNGRGQKRDFENALASPFDLSLDQGMRAGNQAVAAACDADPIIADKPCEKARALGLRDQSQSQAAFAGPRRPADQDAGFANHDGACVKIGAVPRDGQFIPFR